MQLFTLLLILELSLVQKFSFAQDFQSEALQIYTEDEKSCRGPGSDPYRNFVFNGRCNCKKNVKGIFCTECKDNAFALSSRHQKGCLRCFCSGISSSCTSSNWFMDRLQLSFKSQSPGVELVHGDLSVVQLPIWQDSEKEEIYVRGLPPEAEETYYWKLPELFLGDRLNSYGGFLNFSLDYEVSETSNSSDQTTTKKWLKDPLVVMKGSGMTIYYRFRKRDRGLKSHFVPIVEQCWFRMRPRDPTLVTTRRRKRRGRKRKSTKRGELMRILSNVEYIIVKAKFRTQVSRVSLLSLSMSHAVPRADSPSAVRTAVVEKCECPRGYGGLSCQYCSSGYTQNGTSLGRKMKIPQCFPCHCNGHSDSCHPETGVCLNCQHNTGGDHCQHSLLACDHRGTFKREILPHVHSRCVCKARVQGELCDTCKMGFFNLNIENERGCKKCWCSGVTFRCSSSTLRRFQLIIQPPAFVNMGFFDGTQKRMWARKVTSGKAIFHFKQYKDFYDYHWSLPKTFTGNRLKSYGGNLSFSLYNDGNCDKELRPRSFLELESFGGEIITWNFNPVSKMNVLVKFSIRLTEEHFAYYNLSADRSVFLRILASLKSIRIYIPECPGIRSTEISDVILDTAVDWLSDQPVADAVEDCHCPEEYSGLSCENCSPGFVKDVSGRKCVRKTNFS